MNYHPRTSEGFLQIENCLARSEDKNYQCLQVLEQINIDEQIRFYLALALCDEKAISCHFWEFRNSSLLQARKECEGFELEQETV